MSNSSDAPPAACLEPAAEPLKICGELTVNTVAAQHRQLVDEFAGRGRLILDLSGVTTCDTAGLQLVLSAGQTSRAAGRPFAVIRISEAVAAFSAQIGLDLQAFASQPPVPSV
jgi:anti-anti-sigma regulatory factor